LSHCVKCGTKLPEDANFCPACGAPVGRVTREEFSISSDKLIARVKELIHEGNVTRIIVKDEEGKTLLEIPATAGVIGALIAPLGGSLRSYCCIGDKVYHQRGEKRIALIVSSPPLEPRGHTS